MPDPATLQKAVPRVRQGVDDRERALLQGAMMKLRPSSQPVFDMSPERIDRVADATNASSRRQYVDSLHRQNSFQKLEEAQQLNRDRVDAIARREAELRAAAARPKVDVAKLEGVKNQGASKSPWEAWKTGAGAAGGAAVEGAFQSWYGGKAKKLDLDPNPDAPEHKYDYRGAFRAGEGPDKSGHWPSRFKAPDHPNRYVDGIDTITGKKVASR